MIECMYVCRPMKADFSFIHPQAPSLIVEDLLTMKKAGSGAGGDADDVCFVLNAAELTIAVEVSNKGGGEGQTDGCWLLLLPHSTDDIIMLPRPVPPAGSCLSHYPYT